MRHRREASVALFILSLLLFAIQAGLWVRVISAARTETDKQNIVGHQPPSTIPALAGSILLIAAAVVVSVRQRSVPHKPR